SVRENIGPSEVATLHTLMSDFAAEVNPAAAAEKPKADGTTTVLLRNGAVMPKAFVDLTLASLTILKDRDYIAFYELVSKANNPEHKLFNAEVTATLKELGLIQPSGLLHSTIAEVVRLSTAGHGRAIRIVDPVVDRLPEIVEEMGDGIHDTRFNVGWPHRLKM